MKKFLLSFLVIFMLFPLSVFSISLEEATSVIVEKLAVETNVDSNNLFMYYDYGYISKEYTQSVAAAIKSGLLVPDGKFINPKSEDLKPLLNGLSNMSISSNTYAVVNFSEDVIVNPNTLFIENNNFVSAEEFSGNAGWALVTKSNVARVVWEDSQTSAKGIFCADIFLCNGDEIIFKNLRKFAFTKWETINEGYFVVPGDKIGEFDEDYINSEMLDKNIMFVGEITEDGNISFVKTYEKFVKETLII